MVAEDVAEDLLAAASPLTVVAAFGSNPGARDLSPAQTPVESWLRAVALGGQGRYARARAELRTIGPGDETIRSLSLSTAASFVRQQGLHAQASVLDGAALSLAGASPTARCDALTGLAADALGTARLRLGVRLLDRARAELGTRDLWRPRLRLVWVATELALAGGDAAGALGSARHAAELAGDCPSVRHRVKTSLLHAAAECVAGDLEAAIPRARDVAAACAEHGLLPLRWAVAMLLAGIDPESGAAAEIDECEAELARRGGTFART